MRWRLLFCLAFVAILFLSCAGFFVPLDLGFTLLAGWAFYLLRVIPQTQVRWDGVATALICLTGFAFGLHLFLASLARRMGEAEEPRSNDLTVEQGAGTRNPWPVRWSAAIVVITLLMFVSGMAAAGFAHQVGWLITSGTPLLDGLGVRFAARRAQSINNLKLIGVAFNSFNNKSGHYLAGCTVDREGEVLHSWAASVLPFLGLQSLHDRIDLASPWDAPANQAVFRETVPAFLNPAIPSTAERDSDGYWFIHYAGNVHVLGGSAPITAGRIKDGTSQTILAGEAAERFLPWGKPGNWRDPALGINRSPAGFGSPYPGGANVLFLDGSVRFIKNSVDPQVLRALGTPDGGEDVNPDSY